MADNQVQRVKVFLKYKMSLITGVQVKDAWNASDIIESVPESKAIAETVILSV
jgi:hypothetical protein